MVCVLPSSTQPFKPDDSGIRLKPRAGNWKTQLTESMPQMDFTGSTKKILFSRKCNWGHNTMG